MGHMGLSLMGLNTYSNIQHQVIDKASGDSKQTLQAACTKRCGSAGGKAPRAGAKSGRQETQGSCTHGKHEGIARVWEVTRPVPTPPVRRFPHPFTPIERGSEGE
jgi:hypothetical protein